MFVPKKQLGFDLAGIIETAIEDWSVAQPLGFTRPVAESCGDFIAAEMDAWGLRSLVGDEAMFNSDKTEAEFRECVFAALDHWLIKVEISMLRTPEEMADYLRRCGE